MRDDGRMRGSGYLAPQLITSYPQDVYQQLCGYSVNSASKKPLFFIKNHDNQLKNKDKIMWIKLLVEAVVWWITF
jgi:hypothetical protein